MGFFFVIIIKKKSLSYLFYKQKTLQRNFKTSPQSWPGQLRDEVFAHQHFAQVW